MTISSDQLLTKPPRLNQDGNGFDWKEVDKWFQRLYWMLGPKGSSSAYNLPDAIPAGVTAASQAEMEAASDTSKFVTPGRTKYHPGTAKGWINFNGTGTVAIRGSYNVSGLTDNGTGDYTISWDTDFSSVNYSFVTGFVSDSPGPDGVPYPRLLETSAYAAGSLRVLAFYTDGVNASAVDYPTICVAAYGDQ